MLLIRLSRMLLTTTTTSLAIMIGIHQISSSCLLPSLQFIPSLWFLVNLFEHGGSSKAPSYQTLQKSQQPYQQLQSIHQAPQATYSQREVEYMRDQIKLQSQIQELKCTRLRSFNNIDFFLIDFLVDWCYRWKRRHSSRQRKVKSTGGMYDCNQPSHAT
jgi:hypothetical protein